MARSVKTLFGAFLLCALMVTSVGADEASIFRTSVLDDISYDDALQSALDVLQDRGIVLTYHAHAGEMLERTKDAADRDTPFVRSDILGFCKAGLSHDLVLEDPDQVLLCPFSITLYQLKGQSQIVMGYASRAAVLPSKATQAIDDYLQDIVEAIEEEAF